MQMTDQEWQTRREQRRARRRNHSCTGSSGNSRALLGLLLVSAGLLLFLGNLGLFPLHSVFQLWPLALVAIGIARWNDTSHPGSRLWSILLIGFGSVMFLSSVAHVHIRGSWIVAGALITVGVLALSRTTERPANEAPSFLPPGTFAQAPPAGGHADSLSDSAILGSVNRRVDTANLRGGSMTCFMGNIELDLRRAQIANPYDAVTVDISCLMGSIKLRIPETWRFSFVGMPILGSYSDKTVPVARPDFVAGTLVISGICVMGSIEVEN